MVASDIFNCRPSAELKAGRPQHSPTMTQALLTPGLPHQLSPPSGETGPAAASRDAAGRLHRADGHPAITFSDGRAEWYAYGKLHRIGGPAVVTAAGRQKWYRFGVLHREDGPAVVYANGAQKWYCRGFLHRGGGLPAVTDASGGRRWYTRGRYRREEKVAETPGEFPPAPAVA